MAKKLQSGGARLYAAGKKPMTLGLTPEQREQIAAAAKKLGSPMTAFVLGAAIEKARKING